MIYADNQTDYLLKDEKEKIIRLAIEVHKILGAGFWKLFIKMHFSMN